MRPRELRDEGEQDLFRARLDQILDLRHPLVKLAGEIDWGVSKSASGRFTRACPELDSGTFRAVHPCPRGVPVPAKAGSGAGDPHSFRSAQLQAHPALGRVQAGHPVTAEGTLLPAHTCAELFRLLERLRLVRAQIHAIEQARASWQKAAPATQKAPHAMVRPVPGPRHRARDGGYAHPRGLLPQPAGSPRHGALRRAHRRAR